VDPAFTLPRIKKASLADFLAAAMYSGVN
jgi:hypothetical protein